MIIFIIKNYLKKIYITSSIFIVCLPLFFIIIKPHNDLKYHLFPPEKRNVSPAGLADNIYGTVKGEIVIKTLVLRTALPERSLKGCVFRLEGYPQEVIFYLRQGKVFEEIKKIYNDSKSETYREMVEKLKKSETPDFKKLFEKRGIKGEIIQYLQKKEFIFSGRVYSAENLLIPFFHFHFNDDLDVENYFYTIGEDFVYDSVYKNFFKKLLGEEEEKKNYYVMHINETPEPGALLETGFGLFVFVFVIFILGSFFLIYNYSNLINKDNQSAR